MCLSVDIIGLPLKYHVYFTEGIPNAAHGRTTVVFDPEIVFRGLVVHSGFAGEKKFDEKKNITIE